MLILVLILGIAIPCISQQSVARQWNEVLLEAIRNDFARPTVHARNLFHISAAMYDAWAVYDETAETFFLGKTVGSYTYSFQGIEAPSNVEAAQTEAMSFAAYRLLKHRFEISPGAEESLLRFDSLMIAMGNDMSITSTSYEDGSPAALGNYIAEQIIEFGYQDGSNEWFFYANLFYESQNDVMIPTLPGSQEMNDPNRWQPLAFDLFIDQAGFEIPGGSPDFLSPEWGFVIPFALSQYDLDVRERDGEEYWIYHDPGDPCYIQSDGSGNSSDYQWGNELVAIWSSHLDPSDGVMIDISPASIGNIAIQDYPTTLEGLREFYNLHEGGDPSRGHEINPITQLPYPSQVVPRGDYARVLAEFWADGPDSETPPGHWYTILNYVNDHELFEKRFKGQGEILGDLEWDVKAYFTLGGALHDAAITAWSIKGWYDYPRPISSIRYMADQGQSSDSELPNYAANGIPLHDGLVELVLEEDPLSGDNDENIGKIKLMAWKGPEFISDPAGDAAGVDWILAENWWPYQRPTFVNPPFAGYISGHSTFSRAAAEVITLLTGDEFFPGGVGEFVAPKNEFLVFEEGPSVDITLQWATYRDAADQTSLSRIWGGIHPPVDDIPGRLIGEKIGIAAFDLANNYFDGSIITSVTDPFEAEILVFPNPSLGQTLTIRIDQNFQMDNLTMRLIDLNGRRIWMKEFKGVVQEVKVDMGASLNGVYLLRVESGDINKTFRIVIRN
ncbi:MAG: hypothetical protein CBB92_04440 [Flammeovirgaceae bacterium TMED32]|nr:MAG: hypothetical protein CBB92_04440 [Flammeovirgaceae bacterium TMED32]